METRLLPATPDTLELAAKLLREGNLVAFPTETVYGLGANALDPQAVGGIFAAKGRPATDPLIVHLSNMQDIDQVAISIPESARLLMDIFWPGALTLVLHRAASIAPAVSAGLDTLAVRVPSHPVAQALIRAAQRPIAAPSANRFAHTSPTTAAHVWDDLQGRISLIVDAGATTIGVESTILDLTGETPRILRPGGVSLEAIQRYVPNVEVITRFASPEDGAVPAPGMLLKHYSPRASLRLYNGAPQAVRDAIAKEATALLANGKRVGLLVADEDREALAHLQVPMVRLGSLAEINTIAQHLYAGLREIDSADVDIILARTYPADGIGAAVHDRLLRAAEGHIIDVG